MKKRNNKQLNHGAEQRRNDRLLKKAKYPFEGEREGQPRAVKAPVSKADR